MSCIFANSKYYREAKADPKDVAPPLGYQFLNSNKPKKMIDIPNAGQLILKQVYDKPHHKLLSYKKTPSEKIQQFLKVSEVPRKNEYLPPTFIQFIRNDFGPQIFLPIVKQFVPHFKPQYSMIELSQILKNPRIQSVPHIEDYALSKFFYVCQGSDPWRIQYLYQFFNRRLIEYPVECAVVNHRHILNYEFLINPKENPIYEAPDIQNVQSVKDLIYSINEGNRKKDPLYSGVHFYFADFNKEENADYFQREVSHFPLLQYFLTVMSGILGQGQAAIIKLCGAFKHKTVQMIFILKLMFNGKVSLCKTLGSNPFLPDSYIICQYYNKTNGTIIHKYLLQNYHLLKQFNDDKLLLDPKKVLREDLHGNVKLFNQSIIHKGIQLYLKQYKANSNIEYYPSKQKIIERLPLFAMDLQSLVKEMVKIPDKITNEEDPKDLKIQSKPGEKKEEGATNNVTSVPRPTGLSTGGLFSKAKNKSTFTSVQKDTKKG